jgi:hypothetical protein
MAITLKQGELSSSDAAMSWVDMSGFHCRTEHFLLFESAKLFKHIFKLVTKITEHADFNWEYTKEISYLVNGLWFLKSQTTAE